LLNPFRGQPSVGLLLIVESGLLLRRGAPWRLPCFSFKDEDVCVNMEHDTARRIATEGLEQAEQQRRPAFDISPPIMGESPIFIVGHPPNFKHLSRYMAWFSLFFFELIFSLLFCIYPFDI